MSKNSIVRIAHRGASAQFPENTLLAFRQAIEQGVDMLECDNY
jgi:glycerophosphoryl diester phosphodiesterase